MFRINSGLVLGMGITAIILAASWGCGRIPSSSQRTPTLSQTPMPVSETLTPVSGVTLTPTVVQPPVILTSLPPDIISKENAAKVAALERWKIDRVQGIAWAPNSTSFAASVTEGGGDFIKLYDASTYREIWSVEAFGTYGLAFSPDGQVIATSPYPFVKGVQFWDAATGRPLNSISRNDCSGGFEILFAPDGNLILTAYSDGGPPARTDLVLWDRNSATCVGEFAEAKALLISLDISPNGQVLALSFALRNGQQKFEVQLWDFVAKRKLCSFRGRIFTFNLDGNQIIAPDPDADATINFWNTKTCEIDSAFEGIDSPFDSGLALSPNGQLLVIGRETLRLWDATDGQLLYETEELPSRSVGTIKFSPDGRFLISTSPDYRSDGKDTIILWGIKP